jgi:hypothetical protein
VVLGRSTVRTCKVIVKPKKMRERRKPGQDGGVLSTYYAEPTRQGIAKTKKNMARNESVTLSEVYQDGFP